MNRARSPERVLTPLSGILGTRSAGKPAMKLWRHAADVDVAHRVVVGGAASCPGLPARVGQQVDLGARVVVPKGHKRAHEFREGARHGDVVLRHAVRGAGLLARA